MAITNASDSMTMQLFSLQQLTTKSMQETSYYHIINYLKAISLPPAEWLKSFHYKITCVMMFSRKHGI